MHSDLAYPAYLHELHEAYQVALDIALSKTINILDLTRKTIKQAVTEVC